MVAANHGRRTLTPAENAVLDILRRADDDGVETGKGTGTFTRVGRAFRQVDHATCLRLQKAGLVTIDAGGYAHRSEATDG